MITLYPDPVIPGHLALWCVDYDGDYLFSVLSPSSGHVAACVFDEAWTRESRVNFKR